MQKNPLFTATLISLFLFSVVLAIQITTFSEGLTAENLTFTGNENITRNITIYKYANITSAVMNLSGYYGVTTLPSSTECLGDYDPSYPCVNGYDENWNTMIAPSYTKYIDLRLNYTKRAESANWTFKYGQNVFTTASFYCWNYTSSDWVDYGAVSGGVHTLIWQLPSSCIEEPISLRVYVTASGSSRSTFYEGEISFVGGSYPTNTSININNTNIWNHTGEFNETFSPNQTDDFSATLNTALNNGSCDCTGCSISGNNCTINFIFHSDTAGFLQYSAMSINWSEHTKPNITINLPSSTESSKTITINITATDDYAIDYCYYNITRGASTEVSDTAINIINFTETAVLSSEADYVIHVSCNDTSGNVNQTNKSFSVSLSAGGGLTGGGGGGGGGIIQQIAEKLIPQKAVCSENLPPFQEAWEDFKKETFIFANWKTIWIKFKIMWFAYWDYSLCNSGASFIPI